MGIDETLIDELGPDRAWRPDAAWTDVCHFDVGRPAIVARPSTTEEVVRIVRAARATGTPIVPVGERTAYWRPLALDGAIALMTGGLRGSARHGEVDVVGAGEPVRPLDVALRAEGCALPIHPDAYGETSVGSMVASGLTSGIGMGHGGVDRWLAGLTVVLGSGEVLRTGTGATTSDGPSFLRDGLPDATGLFVGSEGTLGVITEVVLERVPAPWRVVVSTTAPDPRDLLDAGRELGMRGLYDTFRVVREIEGGSTFRSARWRVDAFVDSLVSAEEALARAEVVASRLRQGTRDTVRVVPESEAARAGRSPDYDARWQGPLGTHAERVQQGELIGFDVNAPWSIADELLPIADAQAEEAVAEGAPMVRTALYLSGRFVNLGMHTSFARDPSRRAWVLDHQQRHLAALAALPVVPYRPGHVWPAAMLQALQPAWRRWLRGVRACMDPDGICNPAHPLVAHP